MNKQEFIKALDLCYNDEFNVCTIFIIVNVKQEKSIVRFSIINVKRKIR